MYPTTSQHALPLWMLLAVGFVASTTLAGCPPSDPPSGCEGGLCVEDTGTEDECESHTDCAIGEQCIDGECQPATGCENNDDCPGEEICKAGQCYAPEPEDTGVADTGGPDVFDAGDTGPGPDGDVETTDGDDVTDGGCSGCMLPNDAGMDQCVAGNDREACGSGGEACTQCGENEECKNGTCQQKPCSPADCDGCCENGECKEGTSSTACGKGGEACSQCQGDTRCTAARRCESCNGCWTDSDECKNGDTSRHCGTGGETCQRCASDEKCEGGTCIEKSCSETCQGCCDGSSCLTGSRDDACGSGGESCKQCGDGYECDFTDSCDLDRNSRWDVIAISGDVPTSDQNSVFYDHRGNPPDPYIEVEVEGFTETTSGKSDTDKDDTTPFWYDTTAKDVRAADLKRTDKTTFTIKDEDPWYAGGDDKIASCAGNFEDNHFRGSIEWTCVNHKNASQPVEVNYKFKLEYRP